jgi:hypothetical protein
MLGMDLALWLKKMEEKMTFDQWIDAVNAGLKARLGENVRTEELSWDSAMWVGPAGTAVASVADDETTAKFSFDEGDKYSTDYRVAAAAPERISAMIADRISLQK